MDVEFEFDKKCRVSLSPKTVLQLHPKLSSIQEENCKQRKDQSLALEDDRDIIFECHMSASSRSISSRLSVIEGPMEVKRGSVYKDSREFRKMRSMSNGVLRRKIEISRTNDTKKDKSLKHDGKRERCQYLPVHPVLIRVSTSKFDEQACSSEGFIDIDIDINDRRKVFQNRMDGDLCYPVEECNVPVNGGNILLEENGIHADVPEKLETPQTHSNRQSVDTPKSRASTKVSRFSPVKKMMDPFLKSKSHNTPSTETFLSPLPCNFVDMKEHFSGDQESAALLQACLTLKTKSESPLFEFKMKSPEVSFLARIWKRNLNAADWVYTFHSVNARRNWNFSLWGSNDNCKALPLVGQMQVSSRLCSESNSTERNSVVTEFVMYDLANTNTTDSKLVPDSSDAERDISQLPKIPEGVLNDSDCNNLKRDLDADLAYPWEPETLRPNLETAAVIIHIPLENKESFKLNKRVAKGNDKSLPDVNVPEVVVITPAGSHSLPDAEYQGPSSLLDRWRLGGGCECGGWDMGRPLNVFRNSESKKVDSTSHKEKTDHFKLICQGKKDKETSLSVKAIEEGKYNVAFHARLSALQVFSVSVAWFGYLHYTNGQKLGAYY